MANVPDGDTPLSADRGDSSRAADGGESSTDAHRGDTLSSAQRGEGSRAADRGESWSSAHRGEGSSGARGGDTARVGHHDDAPSGAHHDDAPLDPAAMLDLLETQQRSVASQFSSFAWVITGIWGIAWLIGFGALWLMTAFAPSFALPAPVAYGILIVALSIAVLVSIVFGIRSGHGVRESRASAFTGAVYGCTWSISMIGVWVLGSSMASRGMPDDIASYYFTSAFVLMTGVMMVVSAAIWQMKPALVVGIWLVAIAAVAPLFGIPGNYLFLALAGGLVFILFAVGSLLHGIRLKRRASGARRG